MAWPAVLRMCRLKEACNISWSQKPLRGYPVTFEKVKLATCKYRLSYDEYLRVTTSTISAATITTTTAPGPSPPVLSSSGISRMKKNSC